MTVLSLAVHGNRVVVELDSDLTQRRIVSA